MAGPARPMAHGIGERALTAGAAALMLGVAWLPLAGSLPRLRFRLLASLAAACAVAGGFVARRGGRLAFALLWAALGAAVALAIVGLFSIGIADAVAAVFLGTAIATMPNRSGLPIRFDLRYVLVYTVACVAVVSAVLIF